MAQRITQVPEHRLDDQPGFKLSAFEVILRLTFQFLNDGTEKHDAELPLLERSFSSQICRCFGCLIAPTNYVLRSGITFSYSDAGPEGLLKGKRAIVVLTRGGLYSEGPAQVMDAQEPHLRTLLGFIGITDVTFIRAEKLALGAEVQEQVIATAKQQVDHLVEGLQAAAA
ncbi:FMN-dependent NADH-azoreductase [Roseibium sp. M-1]